MTPDDHANTVREALPSMDGHEDNCPCSVGRAHAALDALQAQAEEAEAALIAGQAAYEALGVRAEAAESERDEASFALRTAEAAMLKDRQDVRSAEAERDRLAARVTELEAALRELLIQAQLDDPWAHGKEEYRQRLSVARAALAGEGQP